MGNNGNLISIGLADDHQLFLTGLKRTLEDSGLFKVIHTARNGQQLLENLKRSMPDMVITDLSMPPGLDGEALVRRIKGLYPDLRLIVLSMHNDPKYVVPIMKADVAAYLLKDMDESEILSSVMRVYNEGFFWPEVIQSIMRQSLGKQEPAVFSSFSDKEIQYIKLLCSEKSTDEIAEAMAVSRRTIEYYRKVVLDKLDVKSSTGIVVFALRNGLI